MSKPSFETTKVLVTVITYPLPSRGYRELVCTAGVTEAGDWVRLYPIDYRYRPKHQQFRKYQWIEIGLMPHGGGNDNRKESRLPDLDSIRILGTPLSTDENWKERRKIIDKLPTHTLNQLQVLYDQDRTSLGVVRPKRVLDLKIETADTEWKPEWQALFEQLKLFGKPQKPLRKIPFKFSYLFECADSQKPHMAMIEDWELGALWLNEADALGDEGRAAESVRKKYLDEMCRTDKEVRFFMGTTFPFNSWVVVGVFWPPKVTQTTLF